MSDVEIRPGAVIVGADILARGLALEASAVRALMRRGAITCRCEQGIGDDSGRYRLTFFHRSRRLQIIADEDGHVIRRSAIDFGERPLPPNLRRPER